MRSGCVSIFGEASIWTSRTEGGVCVDVAPTLVLGEWGDAARILFARGGDARPFGGAGTENDSATAFGGDIPSIS